jgi:hypothetical protein
MYQQTDYIQDAVREKYQRETAKQKPTEDWTNDL